MCRGVGCTMTESGPDLEGIFEEGVGEGSRERELPPAVSEGRRVLSWSRSWRGDVNLHTASTAKATHPPINSDFFPTPVFHLALQSDSLQIIVLF